MAVENTLLVLLFILTIGLLIPELLKKFRLPLITLIILAGSIFGPFGFNYVHPDETIEFLGFLGMTFLMLMAGLETDITKITHSKLKIFTMALLNGFVPFVVGLFITKLFGYSWITSIMIGIVFISSSVAIIIPSLRTNKFLKHDTAQLILVAVMVADIISLIFLGFIFQSVSPITNLPLPIYFLILVVSIPVLFYSIPKISDYALKRRFSVDEGYERQLRFVLIIMIGTLSFFTILGVHPILAAFLAGLSLSPMIKKDKSKILFAKLHTLGYGLFVPIFFFTVGMELNLTLFKQFSATEFLMISLIFGLILSKIISGYVAGRLVRLTHYESLIFGSISITQLTTTLAVTYAASTLGLLDSVLVTSIIILSIITTFLGPLLASYFGRKIR